MQRSHSVYSDPILIVEANNIFQQVKNQIRNTPEREVVYRSYDKALSGGAYTLPWSDELKAMCDFDTLSVIGE